MQFGNAYSPDGRHPRVVFDDVVMTRPGLLGARCAVVETGGLSRSI
jgi:hypothetical protein